MNKNIVSKLIPKKLQQKLTSNNDLISQIIGGSSFVYGSYTVWGKKAALVTASLLFLDEFIARKTKYNKHFLTRIVFNHYIVFRSYQILLEGSFKDSNKLLLKTLSLSLSAGLALATDDFLEFKTRLSLPIKSAKNLLNIIECDNDGTGEKYAAIAFLEFILVVIYTRIKFALEVSGGLFVQKGIFDAYFFLYADKNLKISDVIKTFIGGAKIAILHQFASLLYGMSVQLIEKSKNNILSKKSASFLFNNNNILKLLSADNDKGKIVLDNFNKDLTTLQDSQQNIKSFLEETTSLITAIKMVQPDFLDMPLILLPQTLLFRKIISIFTQRRDAFTRQHDMLVGKGERLLASSIENFRLVESDNVFSGSEYIKKRIKNNLESIYKMSLNLFFSSTTINGFSFFIENFIHLISILYFNRLSQKKLKDLSQIILVKKNNEKIVSIFLVDSIAKLTVIDLINANERLDYFTSTINQKPRLATKIYTSQKKIVFSEYKINIFDKLLTSIKYLSLEPGFYLLKGKSGCGKTSFLTDLTFGVSGALSSEGIISLPENLKIRYIGKELYEIPDTKLIEKIIYPKTLDSFKQEEIVLLEKKIIELMKFLEIDNFIWSEDYSRGLASSLYSTNYALSGGQKQKLALINAVVNYEENEQKPGILILDETLNSLDEIKSLPKAIELIKHNFNSSVVILVDHGADHHDLSSLNLTSLIFENNQILVQNCLGESSFL